MKKCCEDQCALWRSVSSHLLFNVALPGCGKYYAMRYIPMVQSHVCLPLVFQRAGSGLGTRLALLRSEGRKHYNNYAVSIARNILERAQVSTAKQAAIYKQLYTH